MIKAEVFFNDKTYDISIVEGEITKKATDLRWTKKTISIPEVIYLIGITIVTEYKETAKKFKKIIKTGKAKNSFKLYGFIANR